MINWETTHNESDNHLTDLEIDNLWNKMKDDQDDQDDQDEKKVFECVPTKNQLKNNNINTLFTPVKQLGKGASCCVLLVASNSKAYPNKLYALKQLDRSDPSNATFFVQEVEIMLKLQNSQQHPNIVSYIDCFIDDNCYYLLIEYLPGETMLQRILNQKYFSERIAANWIESMLVGIKYMHSLNIVHRDLKIDNFMFSSTDPETSTLKIIDFGNSKQIGDEPDNLLIGGRHFLPPESWRLKLAWELKKGDLWTVGVCCFILLTGKYPFHAKQEEKLFDRIKHAQFQWPSNMELSKDCKHFVHSLFCVDTTRRLSASQALNHSWIKSRRQASDSHFGFGYMNELGVFVQHSRLKNMLVNSMLAKMSGKEKLDLFSLIKALKIDRNGKVNFNDIIRYMLINSELCVAVSSPSKSLSKLPSQPSSLRAKKSTNSFYAMSNLDYEQLDIDELMAEISQEIAIAEDGDMSETERKSGDGNENKKEKKVVQLQLQAHSSEGAELFGMYSDEDRARIRIQEYECSLERHKKVSVRAVRKMMAGGDANESYIDRVIQKLDPTPSEFIPIDNITNFDDYTKPK